MSWIMTKYLPFLWLFLITVLRIRTEIAKIHYVTWIFAANWYSNNYNLQNVEEEGKDIR